jgi:hypothetical protein
MRIDKRNHFNNYCCAVAHGRPYVGSDGEPLIYEDKELWATAHYSDRKRTQDRLLVAYDEKKKCYILVGDKLPLRCAQISLSNKD